ncbi:MAG: GntR family transcriptional regulator [Pseudomonadota bacterium]
MSLTAALPKYVQISELLIREISAGRLPVGQRLPPERDLASELGIAVGTLRRAMDELVDKDVIERRHGSGNYIRGLDGVPSIYGFFRLEKINGGGLPTAEVLSVDRLPKPTSMPDIGEGEEAWQIRRIRSLDGAAVAAEEIWLDGRFPSAAMSQELLESLYLHYRERLDLWISQVTDRVGVAPAPDWAPAIGLVPGAMAGEVQRESLDQTGVRVEVSTTWFNADRARYVSRLT